MTVIMPAAEAARPRCASPRAQGIAPAPRPTARPPSGTDRVRACAVVIAVRHDMVEPAGELVGFEMTLDHRARRSRGDGPWQAEPVEQVEELQHAGLQQPLSLGPARRRSGPP